MTGKHCRAVDDASQSAVPAGHNEPHGFPNASVVNSPMSELVRLLGARKALRDGDRSEREALLPAFSDEQQRQMWHNVKGFFDTLAEWAKREAEANENAAKRSDNNAQ